MWMRGEGQEGQQELVFMPNRLGKRGEICARGEREREYAVEVNGDCSLPLEACDRSVVNFGQL